jgi:PhnB protein
MTVSPYLTFNGECKRAFQFYEKALRGKIEFSMTMGESPMADKTPAEQRDRIMHTSLRVGNFVIAGADAPPEYYSKPQGFSVALSVDDPAEADRLFNALAENGNVRMPIQETFWAKRFGMVVDQFGQPWMVNCEKPMS